MVTPVARVGCYPPSRILPSTDGVHGPNDANRTVFASEGWAWCSRMGLWTKYLSNAHSLCRLIRENVRYAKLVPEVSNMFEVTESGKEKDRMIQNKSMSSWSDDSWLWMIDRGALGRWNCMICSDDGGIDNLQNPIIFRYTNSHINIQIYRYTYSYINIHTYRVPGGRERLRQEYNQDRS